MEITVIHGQSHKGSTYHATQEIIQGLCDDNTIIHEFFLPKDGPEFCVGCFRCIMEGESGCPHYDSVARIVKAMEHSDIIIVNSPTYVFEMTGQLKTLFDHLSYMWLSHRPNKTMFKKTGIVVTTAAGAGMKRAAKSVSNQLLWLGVPARYTMPIAVNASSWEEVSPEIKKKIRKKAMNIVTKSHRAHSVGIRLHVLFTVMRAMQKGNNWNDTDKKHWLQNGWLGKERPWKEH